VVYKLDAAGQETVLYSFLGGTDGANPKAGLIFDATGNLYGTTSARGTPNAGTVFKLNAAGQETVLYAFTGGADGDEPLAGLILDQSGNLYGTTINGGTVIGNFSYGVVFKLAPSGHQTVLHSFTGDDDGGWPAAGLTSGPAGNLYGTAQIGGKRGGGVIFKLDTAGHEIVLYSFQHSVYGNAPNGVILDPSGNLYGTDAHGGQGENGYVFKLDVGENLTVLYTFSGLADGALPFAGVIRNSAGNLYGTTFAGGPGNYGNGVVYKLDTTGKEIVLCNFTNKDGIGPYAGVTRDAAGNFYGTTSGGGGYGQESCSKSTRPATILYCTGSPAETVEASPIMEWSPTRPATSMGQSAPSRGTRESCSKSTRQAPIRCCTHSPARRIPRPA